MGFVNMDGHQEFELITGLKMWTLQGACLRFEVLYVAVSLLGSVHNQRIERLWRDVWSVTSKYYNMLYTLEEEGLIDLEEEGLIDLSNAVHLFCVSYVFIPQLQKELQVFEESGNSHPLRTERNLTPNQLWMIGMLQEPVSEPDLTEIQHAEEQLSQEQQSEEVEHGVNVPVLQCQLKKCVHFNN
ncbi:hypothetical protein ILYODFUR_035697 [Ilyodon furcidens]|uniref:Integrase core domain-containing protein n=1 Tax=Ilyodon furcidens TaxID=33524 RepID=A0ABV0T5N1_9TELE